jgi:predicted RNA binding protein YcfA (HicA-like mRNA interferase family)
LPNIPGINHLDAVRALRKAGFVIVRQGKHIVMSNGTRILTIPRHDPVNAFALGGIVRDAGLTVKQFREFLQQRAPSDVAHQWPDLAMDTAGEPYKKLQRALKAEIDEDAWASLYSTVSRVRVR